MKRNSTSVRTIYDGSVYEVIVTGQEFKRIYEIHATSEKLARRKALRKFKGE